MIRKEDQNQKTKLHTELHDSGWARDEGLFRPGTHLDLVDQTARRCRSGQTGVIEGVVEFGAEIEEGPCPFLLESIPSKGFPTPGPSAPMQTVVEPWVRSSPCGWRYWSMPPIQRSLPKPTVSLSGSRQLLQRWDRKRAAEPALPGTTSR